jgi:hypothetical protein
MAETLTFAKLRVYDTREVGIQAPVRLAWSYPNRVGGLRRQAFSHLLEPSQRIKPATRFFG